MKRTTALLVLLLGVAGIAAPTITPTPWRYGVIYWVGEVPEHPEAYVNMATNWVERVFAFWRLVPLPRPSGDWRNPEVIHAWSREKARLLLNPEFSPSGLVLPGSVDGTFWALPPLLFGERETEPLTLVVFADMSGLQESFCSFGSAGFFSSRVVFESYRAILDPRVAALVTEGEGPVVVVSREEGLTDAPKDYLLGLLSHEFAHWATWVWAEEHGLSMDAMPRLLREGLAEYTRFTLSYGEPYQHPVAPSLLHPVAAAWAQQGGLADLPAELDYPVGLSLVDFLVRKERGNWERVLETLPEFLGGWTARLAEWDEEWKAWLDGEPWLQAEVHVRLLIAGALFWATMLEPLFPDVWDLLSGIATVDDIGLFWEHIFGPVLTPAPDALEEMRKRECVFHLVAQDEAVPPVVREQVRSFLARLREHWEAGDWDAYAATYLEAVLTQLKPAQSPEGIP